MLKEEFKTIIKDMDSNLTEYSQRGKYGQKLVSLKEKFKNNAYSINGITYEIDSLNFSIAKGKLIPLYECNNWCYPDFNKFTNDYKRYINQRFDITSNFILKNMYLIILLNLDFNYEEINLINNSLDLLNHYLSIEKNVDLSNDLLIVTFDKCMQFNYKKECVKSLIIKYAKGEFNDNFNKKHLIELMFSKKYMFKEDFEGLDKICLECAHKSRDDTIIEFLLLGQKISQKLKRNSYNWDDKIGETYENFANERRDSKLIQIKYLTDALYYYKKSKNSQKIEELSIRLKKIQKKYKPTKSSFGFDNEEVNALINLLNIIYKKISLDSNKLLDFLIYDQDDLLIPKLKKDKENYNNFTDIAPLLTETTQLKLDNNNNITQILNKDKKK